MFFRNVLKTASVALPSLLLSGCLGASRPPADFPRELVVDRRGRGEVLQIGGRVEAERVGLGTLERRVVITVNGTELGSALLADARLPTAGVTPSRINGMAGGVPVAAVCTNRAISQPPLSQGTGAIGRATFASIRCEINVGAEAVGTLLMIHNPAGFAEIYR